MKENYYSDKEKQRSEELELEIQINLAKLRGQINPIHIISVGKNNHKLKQFPNLYTNNCPSNKDIRMERLSELRHKLICDGQDCTEIDIEIYNLSL